MIRVRQLKIGFGGIFLALTLSLLANAAEEQTPSLDELIAIVTKPISADDNQGQDLQRQSFNLLRALPTYSIEDEDKIVAALQSLRTRTDGILSHESVSILGARRHRELVPEYFSRLETEPNQLTTFFSDMPDREKDPPIDLLRRGLQCESHEARGVVLGLIEWCKAVELRPEVEKLMLADPEQSIRVGAARLLGKLGAPESVAALRIAIHGSPLVQPVAAQSLASVGSEADLDALLPLLKSPSKDMRRAVVNGLGNMQLADPRPVADALLPLLDDPVRGLRISAMTLLGKFHDSRAVPAIAALLKSKKPPRDQEQSEVIRALGSIADEASVALLNAMSLSDQRVQEQVLRIAHPSTAYALWDAYLGNPNRPNPHPSSDVDMVGDYRPLELLKTLADEEIFRAIRLRAARPETHKMEKFGLDGVIEKLAERFPKVAVEPIDTLQSKAPDKPSDRDKDGVPDRLDKYPDDDRRSEDIPVKHFESEVQFPAQFLAFITFADEGPASKNVLFIAIDDDYRSGWITKVNELDPPDYHVATWKASVGEEWPLPNPGDTPGVYRLDPSGVNSQGTVVGTASRKKLAIPLRQDVREAHVTFQSGFVFEKGALRFDPPPPFAGQALNVSYQRINNRETIFGHREMKIREGDNDVFRTFAFLGDHVFRDVPAFDVTAMTDAGHLLCFRSENGKPRSFVWDGGAFQDLGSLSGKPEHVRAYAINQKLQVVGLSDALDQDRCPLGFFWEKGKMRAFSELIPEEFRPYLRSAIPYLIDDTGSITFRAEKKAGPSPQFWPKENFVLQLGEDGNNSVSIQFIGGGLQDDE